MKRAHGALNLASNPNTTSVINYTPNDNKGATQPANQPAVKVDLQLANGLAVGHRRHGSLVHRGKPADRRRRLAILTVVIPSRCRGSCEASQQKSTRTHSIREVQALAT